MTLTDITIRRLLPEDAAALAAFYNELSTASKRTFCPLGERTTIDICAGVAAENITAATGDAEGRRAVRPPAKYDLVAVTDGKIIGWSFLWGLDAAAPEEGPVFGLAVADAHHGKGLGSRLTHEVVTWADAQQLPQVILTVVQDNVVAQHVYEVQGFVRYGECVGEDGLDYYRMRRQSR